MLAGLPVSACTSDYWSPKSVAITLPYGPHFRQKITVHRPRPVGASRPSILLVHGRGWVEGDAKEPDEHWVKPLVRLDFIVANVEYRTASYAPALAAMLDVRRAAARFCREAHHCLSKTDLDILAESH